MLALITGAEQGLGAAIAAKLEQTGYAVHNITGRSMKDGYLKIQRFVEKLPRAPDVIVNNYGINHLSWIGETEEDDAAIVQVNLLGPYWVINAVHHHWGGPCRVVNISSQTARIPQRCTSLYCASKAGLEQLTKVMARELAGAGWVINAVSPGKIEDTEMSQRTDSQVLRLRGWSKSQADKYALGNIPMERFTNTDEMSDLVMNVLALPAYVNGSVIEAHGGV